MSGFELFGLWSVLFLALVIQEYLRTGDKDFGVPLERGCYQAIALFLVYLIS